MTTFNNESSGIRPSEHLAELLKSQLDELGNYPELKQKLDDAVRLDPNPKSGPPKPNLY